MASLNLRVLFRRQTDGYYLNAQVATICGACLVGGLLVLPALKGNGGGVINDGWRNPDRRDNKEGKGISIIIGVDLQLKGGGEWKKEERGNEGSANYKGVQSAFRQSCQKSDFPNCACLVLAQNQAACELICLATGTARAVFASPCSLFT